jgi:hypothetical protein
VIGLGKREHLRQEGDELGLSPGERAWALIGLDQTIGATNEMNKLILGLAACAALATVTSAANAETIDWTTWTTSASSPTSGSADGAAGAVGVSYSGELQSLVADYPSWGPAGTFNGGTVGNGPTPAGGAIQLFGATGATDTITFSHAVTDPVLAIWSLGGGSTSASFVFTNTEPFTIQSGGPNAEYGGGSITQSGETVSGVEGNGTIQFIGTFTSISWTNPQFEDWYGFTVGVPTSVPEPATWALMLTGFAALGGALRARRRLAAA